MSSIPIFLAKKACKTDDVPCLCLCIEDSQDTIRNLSINILFFFFEDLILVPCRFIVTAEYVREY